MTAYDPHMIERKWQRRWRAAGQFRTPPPSGRPSSYIFAGCPFTTGDAHMGHIRSYTISDSFARFRRARGDDVLFSLGFDSFGLPAELEANKRGLSPAAWVRTCSEQMRGQFERLGYSCDWDRSFISSEPDHYRWSQWLFLALLDQNLVYMRDAQVIWCDSCNTVLAAMQADGDVCWRCGSAVTFRQLPQWFLRISAYVDENEAGLAHLPRWNKAALGSQRAILGRVDGFEVEARLDDGRDLTLFMTSTEAFADAAVVAISPNHPEVASLATDPGVREALRTLRQSGRRRADRASRQVVQTGIHAAVPGIAEPLPVVISPQVDSRFGPTAILEGADHSSALTAQEGEREAGHRRTAPAAEPRAAVRYRAQDFPISRQRSWGAPIPLVHCERCGTIPVPREQLPVELPEDPRSTGAALADCEDFLNCACPACGGAAKRETDTLDCHVDALWMWMPICVPAEDRSVLMFSHPELQRWLPIRQIVWGADAGGYLFDQRITARVLQDIGELAPLPQREPFSDALMHQMIQMDGRKMSKHVGNVVNPSELIEAAGADAVRLAVLAAAAPARPFDWNERPLATAGAFLSELWAYAQPRLSEWAAPEAGGVNRSDRLRRQLGRWCDAALAKATVAYEQLEMQRVASNLIRLFEHIQEFERRVGERRDELSVHDREAVVAALLILLRAIAPLCPHIAEELWSVAGNETTISSMPWPEAKAG